MSLLKLSLQSIQSENDVDEFRFMLTEEKREKSLLRRHRSSNDTDEQLLQYLSKRASQFEECDDFFCNKGLTKIAESEDTIKKNESDHAPQVVSNENEKKDICERTIEPPDKEEESRISAPMIFNCQEDSDKEEEKSSNTYIPIKFFIEQKPDGTGPEAKPPIYRNINVIYEFKSRLKKGTYTLVNDAENRCCNKNNPQNRIT
ncbi:unnamed protein product [Nezara viridula]|uniref:Uncharacterized protein n=1 Tax=Nezara viridula TaxID=85310 RepID=A0A9P0E693_NEZVI|nr:unnamed protein product [Nezara viridula]